VAVVAADKSVFSTPTLEILEIPGTREQAGPQIVFL
jgi:hypothetical protein